MVRPVMLRISCCLVVALGFSLVSSRAEEKPKDRLREGDKLVDVLGEFQPAGERFRFVATDDNLNFTVIENLALERVSRVLTERRLWSVSGTVTEFRGSNFLLVTRAILKSRASRKNGPENPAE